MAGNDCLDKIRFKMSDVSGQMRFVSFEISQSAPRCDFLEDLRAYLLNRPLREVDLAHLENSACTGSGHCLPAVKKAITEYQNLFLDAASQKTTATNNVRLQTKIRRSRQNA
jgi:hypothetical protein